MIKIIQRIIKEPQLGVEDIVFQYEKLINNSQRDEFLAILRSLISEGSEKEAIYSFNTIHMIGKAIKEEDIIKQSIDKLSFSESESLIGSLLWLASSISKEWCIDFIKKIIHDYKPNLNGYSYLFNTGIKCIVSTLHWKEVTNELIWAIENLDNIYVIDFLAFFKWKRGSNEFNELLQMLNDKSTKKKVNDFNMDINRRYNQLRSSSS